MRKPSHPHLADLFIVFIIVINKSSDLFIVFVILINTSSTLTCRRQFSSLSNLLVARGEAYPLFPDVLKSMEHRLKTALKTVEWNPFPLDCWTGV